MMDTTALLDVLIHGNQLKRTPRTGWIQRGVPGAESVAAHSYGVAFIVLVLTEIVEFPVDASKALAMAILHDLPEGLTTDIPAPAWQLLPEGVKVEVEREAMSSMFAHRPGGSRMMQLWEELVAGETAESRLVHDADKLDMLLQAIMYQEQTGNLRLVEFWQKPYVFHFIETQAIYDQLRARRDASMR